jgi:hypothetical protein
MKLVEQMKWALTSFALIFQMDHPGMGGLDMLGSPHSSNGGSNGDGNGLSSVGPPMTPLPPGNDYFIGKLFTIFRRDS